MIGYYVHHHGAGHLARAGAIARRSEVPVTGLSSAPRPVGWDGPWLQLPLDVGAPSGDQADPSADHALHWAPLGHPGLRARMARVAGWIESARPSALIVDVSVEVTLMARLMGVPVATMAQPGVRTDDAHQLAYRVANAILAPWPDWAGPLAGVERWTGKLHHLGGLSRFDERPAPPTPRHRDDRPRRVLALGGRGGEESGLEGLDRAERATTPRWSWTRLGVPGSEWEADPWRALVDADVVVTHAGQNAIAEVAAARRPAVVVPEARPFHEQHSTADVLERAGLAVVCRRWPEPERWPALLEAATRLGGASWTRWSDGCGAGRANATVEALLSRHDSACAAR
jgi:hypothetical protein